MKLRNYIKLAIMAVVITTAVSSCQTYKKFDLPKNGAAGEYAAAKDEAVDSAAFGNLSWQELFTDPQLRELIAKALENNTDVKNAKLNVDAAQARLLGAKLSYLPSLAITPSGNTSAYEKIPSKWNWGYSIPLAVSWEIDIFGRLTNAKRSAKAALMQSEAYQQAVRSQIIGAVANTYYALVSLKRQHALYLETADKWAQSVEVMRQMKEAGRYTEVAVVQSEANYSSILASIPDVELQILQLNNTMSLLVGERADWNVNLNAATLMPCAGYDKSIPMSYLAARPDVRAAEQSVATAYYATNIARTAFYPSLSISSNGGFTNILGNTISNPGSWFVQLAGNLVAPLFARGQNIQNLKVAKAQQQQAMNNFEYTLMSACNEVEHAMVTIDQLSKKRVFVANQVYSLSKAVEYNEDLQRLANTTYLEVLTAQQSLLQAQIKQIGTDLSISQATINLYQSLGGGR